MREVLPCALMLDDEGGTAITLRLIVPTDDAPLSFGPLTVAAVEQVWSMKASVN